jgi:hypothetical protein
VDLFLDLQNSGISIKDENLMTSALSQAQFLIGASFDSNGNGAASSYPRPASHQSPPLLSPPIPVDYGNLGDQLFSGGVGGTFNALGRQLQSLEKLKGNESGSTRLAPPKSRASKTPAVKNRNNDEEEEEEEGVRVVHFGVV